MAVVELVKKAGFTPWYEKLREEDFKEAVLNELILKAHFLEKEAEEKYQELKNISLLSEKCYVREGYQSVRYFIMKEVEELILQHGYRK